MQRYFKLPLDLTVAAWMAVIALNGPIVGLTPAGNALCYLQGSTTPINKFVLTYVQQ